MPNKKVTVTKISKISKKITKRVTVEAEETKAPALEEQAQESEVRPKKFCAFCKSKTQPMYTDIATLKRYISDRAKIVSRQRSGACSKHQRKISKQIKYARHLSLLPFVPKV